MGWAWGGRCGRVDSGRDGRHTLRLARGGPGVAWERWEAGGHNLFAWCGDGPLVPRGSGWRNGRCGQILGGCLLGLQLAGRGGGWRRRRARLGRGGISRLRLARGRGGWRCWPTRLGRGGLRRGSARRKSGRLPGLPRRKGGRDEQVDYQRFNLRESLGEVSNLLGQRRHVGVGGAGCGRIVRSASAVGAHNAVRWHLPATVRTGSRRRHVGPHLHLAAILSSRSTNYPIPATGRGRGVRPSGPEGVAATLPGRAAAGRRGSSQGTRSGCWGS